VVERLTEFYRAVDAGDFNQTGCAPIYYKATVQASNDRLNRIRRGAIISGLLHGEGDQQILEQLTIQNLI